MKFLRKAFVCFLTLTVLCSGMNIITSAATDSADSLEISQNKKETVQIVPENICNLLQSLGLMYRDEISSEGYVNRGFAAEISLRVDSIYGEGTASGEMYFDVTPEIMYAYEIETSTSCGYFFGTGDGYFSPENNITPAQMATVLLRIAGYPDSYIKNSQEFAKLVSRTGSYGDLTYPGLAYMLYEYLNTNIVTFSSNVSSKKSSKTVMGDLFDTYEFEGVVTENSITGLWSESDANENEVVISGKNESVIFDIGETDINLMIGRYVKVYYRYDDDKNASVCVYYDSMDKKNNLTEIDLSDIDYGSSTDEQIIHYTNGSKKQKVKYSRKTAIIYNGTYYADAERILDKVQGKVGKIDVIDNNGDNVADVFNIEAFETFIISGVNLNAKTIYYKNSNQSLSLDEEDYEQLYIAGSNGEKVFLEDFTEGMVVSVAKNSDNATSQVVKVLISDKKESGMITKVYCDDDDLDKNKIQIDDLNDYRLLDNVNAPDLGQGVIVMLDAFGNVADIDYSNSGEFAFGIVTKVSYAATNDEVRIKMITAKNSVETFTIKDKLIVDKIKYKNMNELYQALRSTQSIVAGRNTLAEGVYPVRYKIKSDGTLTEIDTASRTNQESVHTLEFLKSGTHYLKGGLIMGGDFALRESTPVFKMTGVKNGVIDIECFDDAKYFKMSNVKDLMKDNSKYDYSAYKIDKDSLFADFIIITSGYGTGHDNSLLVINSIGQAFDTETEEVLERIQGVAGGVEKNVFISDKYRDEFNAIGLGRGDVIRYDTDEDDHLIKVEEEMSKAYLIKHESDGKIYFGNVWQGKNLSTYKTDVASTVMLYGYVLDRHDNYVKISYQPPGTSVSGNRRTKNDMEGETVLVKIPDTVPVTVYDPSTSKKVFASTYDEILDYKHNGSNCSLIAIHMRNATVHEVVVMNDSSLYSDN